MFEFDGKDEVVVSDMAAEVEPDENSEESKDDDDENRGEPSEKEIKVKERIYKIKIILAVLAAGGGARKPNKWISHVKAYSKKHKCTYKEAMRCAGVSYKK